MPPPPKIHCQEILQNPAARLILPNSVPNSAEGLSGPAQNVSVSQATTVTTLENTDTTSNNTGTIFPTADNDSLAESIVQFLLQNNELAMKTPVSPILKRLKRTF